MKKKSSPTTLPMAIFCLFSLHNLYAQNVGIGTTSPVNKLEVINSTLSINAIHAVNNAGGIGTGTSWASNENFAAVHGRDSSVYDGHQYHAGVYGSQITGTNSGGVIGAYSSEVWGGLGYVDGNLRHWGIYTPANLYAGRNVYIGIGDNPALLHQLYVKNSASSINTNAIHGVNLRGTNGNGWEFNNFAGVHGEAGAGTSQFQAGVHGYQLGTGNNSGGVVGVYSEEIWGGLGYTDGNGTHWGVYTPGRLFASSIGIGKTPSYSLDVTGNLLYTGNFVNTSIFADNVGVQGICANTPAYGFGIIGTGGFKGVEGKATLAGSGDRYGLHGMGENGAANNFGVRGSAFGGATAFGVYGQASGGGNNWAGYFSGPAFCTSGVWTSSDRMLKNNIQPLNDAMAIINQLKPSVYTFKTREYQQMHLPEGLQYGFVADELQQVIPGAVTNAIQPAEYDNHDAHKGKKLHEEVAFNAVNYTAVIPILVGAAREQQAIIAAQQKKIENLEKRLSAMEKK